MAFSFLSQELAIDLGTANTIIYQNGSIVLDEPSIVALDVTSGKCIAIGSQAKLMHGRNNPNIKTVRPLKDGVIADFEMVETLLDYLLKKVNIKNKIIIRYRLQLFKTPKKEPLNIGQKTKNV